MFMMDSRMLGVARLGIWCVNDVMLGVARLGIGCVQRRYDMRHEMLTQRALFCHHANAKPGMLSQHFVTHVAPPLGCVNDVMLGVARLVFMMDRQ